MNTFTPPDLELLQITGLSSAFRPLSPKPYPLYAISKICKTNPICAFFRPKTAIMRKNKPNQTQFYPPPADSKGSLACKLFNFSTQLRRFLEKRRGHRAAPPCVPLADPQAYKNSRARRTRNPFHTPSALKKYLPFLF